MVFVFLPFYFFFILWGTGRAIVALVHINIINVSFETHLKIRSMQVASCLARVSDD